MAAHDETTRTRLEYYRDLACRDPQVVSLTFYRDPKEIPRRRLGLRLSKTTDDGGDIRIAELDHDEDSLVSPEFPIAVGDLLVAFNHQACYGTHFYKLQETIAKTSGRMTLHLRKTAAAPLQDELRQAIFVVRMSMSMPITNHHLLAIKFVRHNGVLTIASLHDNNDHDHDTTTNSNSNNKSWLTSSCLEQGQVVLSINDVPCYDLEHDDAQLFLRTKAQLAPHISIKTYAPSRHTMTTISTISTTTTNDEDDTPAPWRFGDRILGRRRQQRQRSSPPSLVTTSSNPVLGPTSTSSSPSNGSRNNISRQQQQQLAVDRTSPSNGNRTNISRQPHQQQDAGRTGLSNGGRNNTSRQQDAGRSSRSNGGRNNTSRQPQRQDASAASKGTDRVAAEEWRRQSLEDTI